MNEALVVLTEKDLGAHLAGFCFPYSENKNKNSPLVLVFVFKETENF